MMRFGFNKKTPLVRFDASIRECMRHLADASLPNETGGILIGYYDAANTCATITLASHAPSDSVSTPTSFQRGTRGLQRLLNRAWSRGEYYLGEWHFHPEAIPTASGVDRAQMADFAHTAALRCPEPILLIIGLPDKGGVVSGYVHLGRLIDLVSCDDHTLTRDTDERHIARSPRRDTQSSSA